MPSIPATLKNKTTVLCSKYLTGAAFFSVAEKVDNSFDTLNQEINY